ncbi:hypothetical protein KUV51_00490 [Tateyamaria omphalii]|nr:hypothetical protein [Tateyamaria omphalii]
MIDHRVGAIETETASGAVKTHYRVDDRTGVAVRITNDVADRVGLSVETRELTFA